MYPKSYSESDSTSSSEGEEMGVANRVGHGGDHGFSPVIDRPGMYYKVPWYFNVYRRF